jgi:DNA-binding transcriptional ArsR family regulator
MDWSILLGMQPQLFFDTLADATRRRILALLATEGELCVCELTAALDEIQPKVSRHLGVMKEAGLVTARREGTWMHYQVATLPTWMGELLAALKSGAAPDLRADLKRLRGMRNRPQRAA